MEQLERLMPRAQRRTNHIFMGPEALLPSEADKAAGAGVVFINDDRQLEDFIAGCSAADKLERRAGATSVLQNIVNSSSITLPGVRFDLAKWSLKNRATPTALAEFDYVVLREDHLQDVRIGELLELYGRTPPLKQPQILFLQEGQGSELPDRLGYVSPAITVIDLQGGGEKAIAVARNEPRTLSDFSDLFAARCFDSVATVPARQIDDWTRGGGRLASLAGLATRIRARLLTAERHDVEPEVDALLRRIASMAESVSGVELEALLSMRTTALLQKLFCSEDPAYLTEAMALASSLDDELGLASCLRYAEFLDIQPALADHMYRRAEGIFRKHGVIDAALYSVNNRLVSGFAKRSPSPAEFADLLDLIIGEQPALHRRHDVFYNAGVHHLLDGRTDQAFGIFTSPEMADARPLIRASAGLGALACSQLGGVGFSASNVMDLAQFTLAEVATSNRWHITNLLLNLMVLVRNDAALSKDLLEIARPALHLSGAADVRDAFDENRRLAAALGLVKAQKAARIPGPFGDFQDRTGLAIPYYFMWS